MRAVRVAVLSALLAVAVTLGIPGVAHAGTANRQAQCFDSAGVRNVFISGNWTTTATTQTTSNMSGVANEYPAGHVWVTDVEARIYGPNGVLQWSSGVQQLNGATERVWTHAVSVALSADQRWWVSFHGGTVRITCATPMF